jgi:hypothetical protein
MAIDEYYYVFNEYPSITSTDSQDTNFIERKTTENHVIRNHENKIRSLKI